MIDTTWAYENDHAVFYLKTNDPRYQAVLHKLNYQKTANGFIITFSKDIPQLESYLTYFKSIALDMVRQAADQQPVPWQKSLTALIDVVKDERDLFWWITGSCALALHGVDISPRDIDLVTDDETARRFAKLLDEYVYQPLSENKPDEWFARYFARAFLHARIEWTGGVFPEANEVMQKNFGNQVKLETINFRGYPIKLAPLNLLLEQAKARNMRQRVKKIQETLK